MAREVEADLDRAIEGNRLADLLARGLDVILLVDRRALDLQEEAAVAPVREVIVVRLPRTCVVLFVQEIDGLGGHGRERRLVDRPLVPRSLMCASRTAGVASVISAVLTLPVLKPACCASSRIVSKRVTAAPVPAIDEMRPLLVFCPVAH